MSLFCPYTVPFFIYYLFIYIIISVAYLSTLTRKSCLRMILLLLYLNICLIWTAGNPRVTPEVTRDVCLLARMMAANLYFSQIEDLMFEVSKESLLPLRFVIWFFCSEYLNTFFFFCIMYFLLPFFVSQLSMWRCNDELLSRAHELHRSSKKDAKHYIGMQ